MTAPHEQLRCTKTGGQRSSPTRRGGGATAQADTRCSWSTITINSGKGAEAPSAASGHKHNTGNHYVGYIAGDLVDWYADNNGGSDGDTWDSYCGTRKC